MPSVAAQAVPSDVQSTAGSAWKLSPESSGSARARRGDRGDVRRDRLSGGRDAAGAGDLDRAQHPRAQDGAVARVVDPAERDGEEALGHRRRAGDHVHLAAGGAGGAVGVGGGEGDGVGAARREGVAGGDAGGAAAVAEAPGVAGDAVVVGRAGGVEGARQRRAGEGEPRLRRLVAELEAEARDLIPPRRDLGQARVAPGRVAVRGRRRRHDAAAARGVRGAPGVAELVDHEGGAGAAAASLKFQGFLGSLPHSLPSL